MPKIINLPSEIRISIGTAIILGLSAGKLDASPTTAYLMTYKKGKCSANCSFCPQARNSQSNTQLLSRVTWPIFPTSDVIAAIAISSKQKKIGRVCIQALNYPEVFEHLETVVKEIKRHTDVAVSVSCQPQNKRDIDSLKRSNVDRIGIALDAATEKLFNQVKGKEVGSTYTWENQFHRLKEAVEIFKEGNVSTHLIVGLGETEKEVVELIERCVDMGVLPALFAFTPVKGTALENHSTPKIEAYRRVQLARYIIVYGIAKMKNMSFNNKSEITNFGTSDQALEKIIENKLPFQTSGCPDCNRPFYNEKPKGPIYNYPFDLNKEEIDKIKKQLSY